MTSSACDACGRRFGSPQALADHTRSTHANPNWLRSQGAKGPKPPTCPTCGGLPLISAGRFGTKAECCGLWSWGMKPLVDGNTHRARIWAHEAFDRIWKSGVISRGEAYRRLQHATGLSSADCHIALMDIDQAHLVMDIVRSGILLADPTPDSVRATEGVDG